MQAEEIELPTLEEILQYKGESLAGEYFQEFQWKDLGNLFMDRKLSAEKQKRKLQKDLEKVVWIFKANFRAWKFLEKYLQTVSEERDRSSLGFGLGNAIDWVPACYWWKSVISWSR